MEAAFKYLVGEGKVVLQAPTAFFTALILCGGLIFAYYRHHFAGRLADLESRVKLRDDQIADYKSKLNGASPDEARSRMDRLEARLQEIREQNAPRTLTTAQVEEIRSIARQNPGHIRILTHPIVADAAHLAMLFQYAFSSSGWKTSGGTVVAPHNPADHNTTGLAVLFPKNRTPATGTALQALAKARIDFSIGEGFVDGVDVEIVVSAKEASAQMANLQNQVASLTGQSKDLRREIDGLGDKRLLTEDQVKAIRAAIGNHVGQIRLLRNAGSAESAGLHKQLSNLFRGMGWSLTSDTMPSGLPGPRTGLALVRDTQGSPMADDIAIEKALSAAGVRLDIRRSSRDETPFLYLDDMP